MKSSTVRKGRLSLLVVALLALSVGVTVGLAKSGPSHVKSGVYKDTYCFEYYGYDLGKQVGTVDIQSKKGNWRGLVKLRGAVPGLYHVDLYDDVCSTIETYLGHFKVGSDGKGNGSFSYAASGFQYFYVRVHNEDTDDSVGSPLLKIGGNPA